MFIGFAYGLAAQSDAPHPCATPAVKSEWLKKYQSNPTVYPKSDEIIYVPITIHIVGTNTGGGFFDVPDVLEAFCTLNQDFEPTQIQFFIEGDINYISNSAYYDHPQFSTGIEMMQLNNVANTINCYIVVNPAGACGYSSYNNGIALRKSCIQPEDHTWAHEIGHFLSLPHTFFGWEYYDGDVNFYAPAPETLDVGWDVLQVEKVDGSNCYEAADGFCDTPPDYISDRWSCDDLSLSTQKQLDPDSTEFVSDGTYFMSYAGDACMYRFSDEQIEAMRANLYDEKPNFLYNQTPSPTLSNDDFFVISPLNDEVVPFFDQVTLDWEPIDGATLYHIEITPNPEFTFVLYSYVVDSDFLTTSDLKANRTYYWRVSPFNRQYTCTQYSDVYTFSTNDVTDIPIIEGLLNFSVMPNPVASGNSIDIHFGLENAMDLNISLYSLTGQLMDTRLFRAQSGNNRMSWDRSDFPPGMYFIGLENGQGKHFEKIIIQ